MTAIHPDPAADVVVIGGGIIGVSIAWHLARLKAGRIILLERDSLLGTGSTGRCAGGFRHQFSTEINIRLSLLSIPRIIAFGEEMDWPVDIHQDGYLFLLSTPAEVDAFRHHQALQHRLGITSEMPSPEAITRLAPRISLEGILAGGYCAHDGIADPNGMTQGYASGARRLGVEIRTGVSAIGIRSQAGRILGVDTSEGYLPCGAVVNAAGPHAREVASWARIDLPVFPERRHVYSTFPFSHAPDNYLMVIEFTSTFYFHRESGGVLMGMGNPAEPYSTDLSVDPDFLEKVLAVGLNRYPSLADAAINRTWTGLYEMSPDAHPVLGKAPGMEGLYFANGFSGHGFQHAPAVGLLLAEEIVLGSSRTLDIAPLRLDRFQKPVTFRESNVV
jgi:sarcosine oxidase subunit beta